MVRIAARLVAPIALVAVALGVYLIVHSTLTKHHVTSSLSQTTLQPAGTSGQRRRHQPRIYVVRPGDTLSSIAQRTGVSMSRLTALNPSVASPPYSLQTGERLRLRR